MENEVYEKDYSSESVGQENKLTELDTLFLKHITENRVFEKYQSAVNALPKYIIPKDKETYEDLLQRLDVFAKTWNGKIRGVVDYEQWEATITVTLPFFECSSASDFKLLSDIAAGVNLFFIEPEPDGGISLIILIDYFAEIGDKDNLIKETILSDDSFVDLLLKYHNEERDELLGNPAVAAFLEKYSDEHGLMPEELIDMLEQIYSKAPKKLIEWLFRQDAEGEKAE